MGIPLRDEGRVHVGPIFQGELTKETAVPVAVISLRIFDETDPLPLNALP